MSRTSCHCHHRQGQMVQGAFSQLTVKFPKFPFATGHWRQYSWWHWDQRHAAKQDFWQTFCRSSENCESWGNLECHWMTQCLWSYQCKDSCAVEKHLKFVPATGAKCQESTHPYRTNITWTSKLQTNTAWQLPTQMRIDYLLKWSRKSYWLDIGLPCFKCDFGAELSWNFKAGSDSGHFVFRTPHPSSPEVQKQMVNDQNLGNHKWIMNDNDIYSGWSTFR